MEIKAGPGKVHWRWFIVPAMAAALCFISACDSIGWQSIEDRGGEAPSQLAPSWPVASSAMQAAPSPTASSTPSSATEQSLVIGYTDALTSLDPAEVEYILDFQVMKCLFDTLVRVDFENNRIVPGIAESWKRSSNRLTWTFKLREGVRFHDGAELDAQAVAFSFERQRSRKHPFYTPNGAYWHNLFSAVKKTEAREKYIVEIQLKEPYAPLLRNLALANMSIISPTAMQKGLPAFLRNPVGSGPFRFESRDERNLVLVRNENYFDALPRLEKIVLRNYQMNAPMALDLSKNKLDMIFNVSYAELPEVSNIDDVVISEFPMMALAFIALNTKNPPLDDIRVRKAILAALRHKELVETVYPQAEKPAVSFIPEGAWGHNPSIRPLRHNLKAARRLLRNANYDFDNVLSFYYLDSRPENAELAATLKKQLAEIGIKIKPVRVTPQEHLKITKNGRHHLATLTWVSDNGFPDTYINVLFAKENAKTGVALNISFLRDDTIDKMLQRALMEEDIEAQEQLYRSVQKLIMDRAVVIPLSHPSLILAYHPRVKDLKADLRGFINLKDIYISGN